jgi:hypothetical protein
VREVQRQPLLADAGRAQQQKAAGQGAAAGGVLEPLAERLVAEEGDDGHGHSMAWRRAPREVAGGHDS